MKTKREPVVEHPTLERFMERLSERKEPIVLWARAHHPDGPGVPVYDLEIEPAELLRLIQDILND